jgi:hypothetical protein
MGVPRVISECELLLPERKAGYTAGCRSGPDFGSRFFTYQIADARSNSFGNIGKQYGTKPGFYLIVGPNWKGTVPSGITEVLHSPTDLVAVFPRVFQADTPED